MLTTGQAHLKSASNPGNLTYEEQDLASGFGWAMSTYSNSNDLEPQGDHIGWFKRENNGVLIYLEKSKAYACVQKAMRDSNTSIPTTENTLFRHLKESGKLLFCDKDRTTAKKEIAGKGNRLRVAIVDPKTIFPDEKD